ncbi:guanine nucleotide-binding protein G(k) subunit alpha, partial [Reticulomyxa filosa]
MDCCNYFADIGKKKKSVLLNVLTILQAVCQKVNLTTFDYICVYVEEISCFFFFLIGGTCWCRSLEKMKLWGNKCASENAEAFKAITDISTSDQERISPLLVQTMKQLWKDGIQVYISNTFLQPTSKKKKETVQSTFTNRETFGMFDNAHYFINDLKRIMDPDYEPTFDDILRTRVCFVFFLYFVFTQTTGVVEEEFIFRKSKDKVQRYVIVDVGGILHLCTIFNHTRPHTIRLHTCITHIIHILYVCVCVVWKGQRSERLKWMNLFADLFAVLWVFALSSYDQ